MTEATPAGFGAHVALRSDTAGIVSNYLNRTRPNVLFGGGGTMSTGAAAAAGYTVVTNRAEMLALDTETTTMACGLFGPNGFPYEFDGIGPLPHLSEMTDTALKILDTDTNGFFLMVEGAKIDDAAHAWDTTRCVREIAEFDRAVSNVYAWMAGRVDTLAIVVADHETCVISGVQDNGPGNDPTVQWIATGHTTNNVGLFACGMNSSVFFGAMQNTNIFHNIVSAYQSGLIDGDMDGMIDSWEIRCFESTNDPSGAASGDPDGDGRLNLDEFVAGTDPTDGASFFPLEVYRTNSLCNVQFSTVAATGFDYVGLNRYYDLYDCASTNGPFLPVSGFTNIFGGNQAVTNTAADTAKYYRVLIRLP
jgi:hypothetical protein